MKKTCLLAASLLLCASTAATAAPRPIVVTLVNAPGRLLNPLLAISGPFAGGFIATYSPIAFNLLGRLGARPIVNNLLNPPVSLGRLPGLK